MLAWLMRTKLAIRLIEKWSYDYIKMDCEEGKCYGVLAVRRVTALLLARAQVSPGPPNLLRALSLPCDPEHRTCWYSRYERQTGCNSEWVRFVGISFCKV
jgi:hypothetical protein